MDDGCRVGVAQLHVTVVWSFAPRQTNEKVFVMPAGACVRDAVAGAGLEDFLVEDAQCAVWGKSVPMDWLLKPGDRVECLRPLLVDPKTARRERFQQQGRRTAGLFTRR